MEFNPQIERFKKALLEAGIPNNGLSAKPLPDGSLAIEIHFQESATQTHRTQALQILAGFDLRPRKPRRRSDLITALKALRQSEVNDLSLLLLAERLASDPLFAERAGIALPGDELESPEIRGHGKRI